MYAITIAAANETIKWNVLFSIRTITFYLHKKIFFFKRFASAFERKTFAANN